MINATHFEPNLQNGRWDAYAAAWFGCYLRDFEKAKESGCWNLYTPEQFNQSSLLRPSLSKREVCLGYTEVGKAIDFVTEKHRIHWNFLTILNDPAYHEYFPHSGIPLKFESQWVNGTRSQDSSRTVCHHPLLCEISSIKHIAKSMIDDFNEQVKRIKPADMNQCESRRVIRENFLRQAVHQIDQELLYLKNEHSALADRLISCHEINQSGSESHKQIKTSLQKLHQAFPQSFSSEFCTGFRLKSVISDSKFTSMVTKLLQLHRLETKLNQKRSEIIELQNSSVPLVCDNLSQQLKIESSLIEEEVKMISEVVELIPRLKPVAVSHTCCRPSHIAVMDDAFNHMNTGVQKLFSRTCVKPANKIPTRLREIAKSPATKVWLGPAALELLNSEPVPPPSEKKKRPSKSNTKAEAKAEDCGAIQSTT
jgi:hypothetical protein